VLVPAGGRAEGAKGVVFVFAGGRSAPGLVTLGESLGPSRQVLSGLREGERVVLAPPESLRDGDAVKLAEK
jgi:multidrug efflux pump subunit AcrA (membrane-fusion protein)